MDGKIIFLKHNVSEGPGTIAEHFFGKYDLQVIELWDGGKLPQSLSGLKAVFAMGGPMNVYEEEKYPFLKAENEFIQNVIKEGVPYLGVCLGAQLLAKACGSKVKKNGTKELGWYEVVLSGKGKLSPLFAGLPEKFNVFQWHEDTFEIPADGANLAGSKLCDNQALQVGRSAYGLQFHIEATTKMITGWLAGEKAEDRQAILEATRLNEAAVHKTAKQIYDNFEKIIS